MRMRNNCNCNILVRVEIRERLERNRYCVERAKAREFVPGISRRGVRNLAGVTQKADEMVGIESEKLNSALGFGISQAIKCGVETPP